MVGVQLSSAQLSKGKAIAVYDPVLISISIETKLDDAAHQRSNGTLRQVTVAVRMKVSL
jgi:hypothetical protein